METYRVFEISVDGCNEKEEIIREALDHSEVLFYEIDLAGKKVYICNCDNCERAARLALQEVGITLIRIN
ncbi:hypothetical protein ACTQ6A_04355 [Lachnospiraceae bacterium LCP25S3_G4]